MAALADAFVRIRPDLTGFPREAERGLAGGGYAKAGETHGRTFGASFGTRAGETMGTSIADKLSNLGRTFGPGLAASFGVGAVTQTISKVIGGASDLNETISKSRQVFGASSEAILQWSKGADRAMGLSQRAALDGASSFQNLFAQIGITGDTAAGMSTNLVKLAGDFASFHNARPEEVMDALLSATRGEYDALQRFVPTVSAAAIETQALAETHKRAAKELTNAEKATALYHLVVNGAGAATGDFARTAGGAANQQRIFTAELENTAAQAGQMVLPAYTGLLQAVNSIGPGTIVAAAGVAVLSNRVAASGAGVGVFRDLKAAHQLYAESVVAGTPRISAALQTAGAATAGLRGAASGVVGLFGGPWGLALTAATVGVGLLTQRMAENKARTEAAVDAYVRFGDAVRAASTDTEISNLIAHNEEIQRLILQADRYGVSGKTVVDALQGEKTATNDVNDALARKRAELTATIAAHTLQGGRSGAVMDDQARKAAAEVQEIDRLRDAFGQAAAKQAQAAGATSLYSSAAVAARASAAALAAEQAATAEQTARLRQTVAGLGDQYAPLGTVIDLVTDKTKTGQVAADGYAAALKGLAQGAIPPGTALTQYGLIADTVAGSQQNAAERAATFGSILQGVGQTAGASGPVMDTLTRVFQDVAASELTASQKADLLKQSWQQMYGPAISQTDATESFNLSLFTLKDSLDKGSTSLDINNAAGIRNRDTVQALIQRNNDLYFANIAAGMSAEQAAAQHDTNAKEIEKAGVKAGLSQREVHGLNDEYGKIPPNRTTEVKATGVQAVLQQLQDLFVAQRALSEGITVEEARRRYTFDSNFNRGHATGGPIFGPGTGTSDSIPARLSAGEHVWTAAEVVAAGGHTAVEALRKFVLHGRSPRVRRPGDGSEGIAFAAGGPVWPSPVSASKTKIPSTPVPAGALDAQAWIRAQAGKPYIWASAGPQGYDCSGLVSAAYLLMHGRNPYNHLFSTMDEAGYFPKPGPGLFTAGWSNAGERGGGSVGHTAARLGGLMFESRGGAGVVVGSGVTPLSSFAHIGHYARGGRVRRLSMDTGFGVLDPGRNVVDNGTGSRETITAGPVRLDDWTISRIGQVLSARPVVVKLSGPDWDLAVAGVAP